MKINPSKCATFNYSGPGLSFNNLAIPQPIKYKYLGIPVTSTGPSYDHYLKARLHQGSSILKSFSNSPTISNWHPIHKLTLFKLFIRSTWEYTLPIAILSIDYLTRLNISKLGNAILTTATTWILQQLPLPPAIQSQPTFHQHLLQLPSYLDRADQLITSLAASGPVLPQDSAIKLQLSSNSTLLKFLTYLQTSKSNLPLKNFISANYNFRRTSLLQKQLQLYQPFTFSSNRTITSFLSVPTTSNLELKLLTNFMFSSPSPESTSILQLIQTRKLQQALLLLQPTPSSTATSNF